MCLQEPKHFISFILAQSGVTLSWRLSNSYHWISSHSLPRSRRVIINIMVFMWKTSLCLWVFVVRAAPDGVSLSLSFSLLLCTQIVKQHEMKWGNFLISSTGRSELLLTQAHILLLGGWHSFYPAAPIKITFVIISTWAWLKPVMILIFTASALHLSTWLRASSFIAHWKRKKKQGTIIIQTIYCGRSSNTTTLKYSYIVVLE